MGDVTWIKIKVDMFDDEKIKLLQALPEGDAILVIWVSLITLAGKSNANGYLLVNQDLPYTDEMLSTIFRKPISIVRLALSAFENYGMIERTSGAIYLVNFEKHQNLDKLNDLREYNRIKQKEHREKLKLSNDMTNSCQNDYQSKVNNQSTNSQGESQIHVNDKSMTCQPCQDIEEDKDKEIDRYISSSNEEDSQIDVKKTEKVDWNKIKDTYNTICNDLPKIKCIDDKRKSKIKALMNAFDKAKVLPSMSVYQRLEYIFSQADESDFLSGRNPSNTWCGFDWLINSTNAIKVIEGNYKNQTESFRAAQGSKQSGKPNNRFNDFPQRKYSENDYADLEKKLLSKSY